MPIYTKDIPIIVEAVFAKSIPKSWSKKKREAALRGEILPTSRPDVDNYLKTLDALIGLAYEDDSQIVQTIAEKKYAENPYVEIRIRAKGEDIWQ
jgi:Holliday junction resolvase RusA-like endonuclease